MVKNLVPVFTLTLILGACLCIFGYNMMNQKESIELEGELWLSENSILGPESIRLAWGVRAPTEKRPDIWIFKIHLKANDTIWIKTMWYEKNQVFYEWYGSALEDSIKVKVDEKSSAMEWTWYLDNTSNNTVEVETFHITYSAYRLPNQNEGIMITTAGTILFIISLVAIVRLVLSKSVS